MQVSGVFASCFLYPWPMGAASGGVKVILSLDIIIVIITVVLAITNLRVS